MLNYHTDKPYSNMRLIETLRNFYESRFDLFHKHGQWIAGVYTPNTSADDFAREWQSRTKPLRNVVPRAVDFFGLKMLPGEIDIVTDDDTLETAIEQVLKWSNFDEKKKLYLTDDALTGEVFFICRITGDKVWIESIRPEDVTELDEDWRGYITDIRIEYEVEAEDGTVKLHTERWTKEYYSIWEHTQPRGTPYDELPSPIEEEFLSAYGLDFCPIVHIKFKDIGKLDHRGVGCVTQSLPVIEEACREATDVARQAFRGKSTWVLSAASVDANNFTLDPIKVIKQVSVIEAVPGQSQQNVTPDDIWQAPAMSTITSLLAGIDWNGLQNLVDSTMEELNQEIPALRYWSMKDQANIAAKTVTLLMDAALSQARESARSFVSGLIRSCQIALTMGLYQGLFTGIGDYASGAMDFDITAGEAFEPSIDDQATTLQTLKNAGLPLPVAMKLAGFSDDEIDQVNQLDAEAQAAKVDQLKAALGSINQVNAKPVESEATKALRELANAK
jgi:hypothetical protein